MEGANAAYAVPRIRFVRGFEFPLVSFQEAGHKKFLGQGREFDPSSFPIPDRAVGVVEVDHFRDGSWLRRVVRDLVPIGGGNRLATREAHERVSVGWRHVDPTYLGRTAEKFFDAKPSPLGRELRTTGEDPRDSGIRKGLAAFFQGIAEPFQQLGSGEHALDVVVGTKDRQHLIDAVLFVFFQLLHLAVFDEFDDPPWIQIDAKANASAELAQMFNGQSQPSWAAGAQHQPIGTPRKILVGQRFAE